MDSNSAQIRAAPVLADFTQFATELFVPLAFEEHAVEHAVAYSDYGMDDEGKNRWKAHPSTTVSKRYSSCVNRELQLHAHARDMDFQARMPSHLEADHVSAAANFGHDRKDIMDISVNESNRSNQNWYQLWDGNAWISHQSTQELLSGVAGMDASKSTKCGPSSIKIKVVMRSLFARLELDSSVAKNAASKCFHGGWDGFTRGLHLGSELEAELESESTTEMRAQTFKMSLQQVGGAVVETSQLSGQPLQTILDAMEDIMLENAQKPDLWKVLSVDVQQHPTFEYPVPDKLVSAAAVHVQNARAGGSLTHDNLLTHSKVHGAADQERTRLGSTPPALLGREDFGDKMNAYDQGSHFGLNLADPEQAQGTQLPPPMQTHGSATAAVEALQDMAKQTEIRLETFQNDAQRAMDDNNKMLEKTWQLEIKHTENANDNLKKKLTQASDLAKALNVDKPAVRRMDLAERLENMSRIVFFLALLSAEMAVMSYVMNAVPLWNKAAGEMRPVSHALIILSPVAYVTAIGSFFFFQGEEPEDEQGGAASRLRRHLRFAKTELLIEHWMVGCRMFLAIKSISEEDIAAFFLVHRLTAIVFSFFQGLLLTILHFQDVEPLNWRDWNLEWLVIGSVGINFLIEAAALSGFVLKLKHSIKMEALVYNNKKLAMFDRVSWMVLANSSACGKSESQRGAEARWVGEGAFADIASASSLSRRINVAPDVEVTAFRLSIEQEIRLYAGDSTNSLALGVLDMEMLVDLQHLMQRRHIRI